jgi:hypothetical protein
MGTVSHPRPLREDDDRSQFDCGRDSLTAWFVRHAWSNHVEGISRVNVLTDLKSGKIVGYATLSAAHIERSFLPKPLQRNRPDPAPATLLGSSHLIAPGRGKGTPHPC